MKTSEFIEYLETQKKEHGDVDVMCIISAEDGSLVTYTPTTDTRPVYIAGPVGTAPYTKDKSLMIWLT